MNFGNTSYSSIKYEIVYQAQHGTWYPWDDKIIGYDDKIPVQVIQTLNDCKKNRPNALGYKIIRTRLETSETIC